MRIKELTIETSGLKELADFYTTVLELPVKMINEETAVVSIGYSQLVLKQSSAGDPFYHFAINIPSNALVAAKDWLSKKIQLIWINDYNSEIADFVNWKAQSIYFFDPAGNILELIARSDLKNPTGEIFSAKQLLSINEAGLVFAGEELDTGTEHLLQKFHLSYFDKQPPLPQFKAVGDDEGLFVIVPAQRNWFPTAKPSGIFPMSISFEHEGDLHLLSSF